jgi:7,8-dihydroneopterin aldolase/epimerase/oxygenase
MSIIQQINIQGLRLHCHVGVPDEEIAVAQELLMDVTLEPLADWSHLNDDIAMTIDYAAVVTELEYLARDRPRRLIETLAVDAVEFLMARYPLQRVRVSIEKFILPQTRCVAVILEKSR